MSDLQGSAYYLIPLTAAHVLRVIRLFVNLMAKLPANPFTTDVEMNGKHFSRLAVLQDVSASSRAVWMIFTGVRSAC